MSELKKSNIIAGLDIGTTKVIYVIASKEEQGIEILGVGRAQNPGMKHGMVTNIEETTAAIKKAKDEAELMAGFTHSTAWLGVSGSHIESFDSQGMIAISNREVADEDIDRVIAAAKAVVIPTDKQLLHVLPTEYKIDGRDSISDPIGMSGVRLECSVHIITGDRSAIQNLVKCAEKAGVKVEGLVLQQLASALSVLGDDEKQLGVTVIDIGGGTCDVITYLDGSVVHTHVLPVGGYNFTHDVAMGLRTTQQNAEQLKKKYGCALIEMVSQGETIEVEGVGGRQQRILARKELCEILEARAEETLHIIKASLTEKGLISKLGSGVVLTGGASQLPGLVEMGDFILDIPVRIGVPNRAGGLTDIVRSAEFSTAVGLILYGEKRMKKKVFVSAEFGFIKKIQDYFSKLNTKINESL